MSLSYAAHINGDKVYDIATGYWIEAKQEPSAMAGRMQWNVYLYDDEGTFVEKYAGGNFPEADKEKWRFVGFDMNINTTNASWRIFTQTLPSYSVSQSGSGTSTTLKQYFSGEQGYAINADYAVIDVQPYSITENGTYTAPFSKAYSPVTVDVQEQPWQPLEDGYSNFWFELTNDTLSPRLNFSAKNNDAVIDWGDGSGEVALDTLTPTHTYSKAGKYIVKVKGVKRVAAQADTGDLKGEYASILRAVEHNSDVTSTVTSAYRYLVGLENVKLGDNCVSLGSNSFDGCSSLKTITLASEITTIPNNFLTGAVNLKEIVLPDSLTTLGTAAFQGCFTLTSITIPALVDTVTGAALSGCRSLKTVHIQAITPPTLGNNTFYNVPSDFIIYVPVGYGETYKAAAGWSTYADHILEEGQTPNRAMLSRLAKAVETDTDEDMR